MQTLPPNVKYVYPWTKDRGIEEIDDNLNSFIDKHEKLMIVAFGTMFALSKEYTEELIKFAKKERSYGFIISLK